jgi:membrane fusion protein, heavy metal efflux system
MKNESIIYIIAAGIFLGSCTSKSKNEEKPVAQGNMIIITDEQFETGKMSLGEPSNIQFDEIVRCNGNIIAQPSGIAKVSTSVPGILKRIFYTPEQKINSGQILFELTGNEFLDLQKDFAETASQLVRIRSEYERVKSLFSEKVGSEKEMILAESDYKAAYAKYSSLKMKLNLAGLDALRIEEGNFYESFFLKSPLSGYISRINVSVGQYADQQTAMAEIIDVSQLRLRIAIFEKDLDKLKENQKIIFNMSGNTYKSYTATLKYIGKNVDSESKAIMCFADIDDLKSANFVHNAYVEASVITSNDTVMAIPEESIIKSDGNNYILAFVKKEDGNYFLQKVKVDTGRLNNGYVELLNHPDINTIITKGAYNLLN